MRTTSSVKDTDFPFADDLVPFIAVIRDDAEEVEGKEGRGFEHASTHTKKRELVEFARQHEGEVTLLAIWPGATRSDVFEVDDLDAALEAFA